MKRKIASIILFVLIILQGCQKAETDIGEKVVENIIMNEKNDQNEDMDNEDTKNNLESWIGLYRYCLEIPDETQEDHNCFVGFSIRIYEEEEKYFADIISRGDKICSELLAQIEGDENTIDFLFLDILPLDTYYGWDEMYEYEEDDLLLSFMRNDNTIQTHWGMLETEPTYFTEHKDKIVGEYFKKVDMDDVINENLSSWVGTYQYKETISSAINEEVIYTIKIYEENGKYYANIAGRGKKLYSESLAYIKGDENAINFFFIETLPEDAHYWKAERYNVNDLLLSFWRRDKRIETSWKLLQGENPVFADSKDEIIGEYFEMIDAEQVEMQVPSGKNKGSDLSVWVNSYYYCETFPHSTDENFNYFIGYEIEIFEEDEKYYAKITGDGWWLCSRILARIEGDENSIDILFVETLPDDLSYGGVGQYGKDDRLLSFSRKEDMIQTNWGELRSEHPTFSDRKDEIIGEYFKKSSMH